MFKHTEKNENREVSSQNDRCNFPHCKNQVELQLKNKKPLPNIHVYHHLKKRQGPPTKKEVNKEFSIKHKVINKESAATHVKHKVDRSKEAYAAFVAQQYHMVSHSQRDKEDSENKTDQRLRIKEKSNFQEARLVQINQNPENSRLNNFYNVIEDRGIVDARPNYSKHLRLHQKYQFK